METNWKEACTALAKAIEAWQVSQVCVRDIIIACSSTNPCQCRRTQELISEELAVVREEKEEMAKQLAAEALQVRVPYRARMWFARTASCIWGCADGCSRCTTVGKAREGQQRAEIRTVPRVPRLPPATRRVCCGPSWAQGPSDRDMDERSLDHSFHLRMLPLYYRSSTRRHGRRRRRKRDYSASAWATSEKKRCVLCAKGIVLLDYLDYSLQPAHTHIITPLQASHAVTRVRLDATRCNNALLKSTLSEVEAKLMAKEVCMSFTSATSPLICRTYRAPRQPFRSC